MLSRRVIRASQSSRFALLLLSSFRYFGRSLDQARDPLHQTRDASKHVRAYPERTGPLDAAASESIPRTKANREGYSGNPENIGMVDQVGSQSASANRYQYPHDSGGIVGEERITPPSFSDAVKKKMGMKTTVGEDKQNRGAREGVMGTGIPRFDSGKRFFSTTGFAMADRTTKGRAPAKSRQPKEHTNAEQNPHLGHRQTSGSSVGGDVGRGNAADTPTLPSHQFDKSPSTKSAERSSSKRAFSTSARSGGPGPKHTAESYFKDVDSSPPASTKTHQVDPSGTGAMVQRPNENLTGEFSRAGMDTKEYETVDRKHPYDTPPSGGPENQQKLRYGGKPNVSNDETGSQVSSSKEGPGEGSKWGRKPEGAK